MGDAEDFEEDMETFRSKLLAILSMVFSFIKIRLGGLFR